MEILYLIIMVLLIDFFYIGIFPSVLKIFPMITMSDFGGIVFEKKIRCAETSFPGFWIENGINTRTAYRKIIFCENGMYFKNTLLTYILGVYFKDLDTYEICENIKGNPCIRLVFKNGNFIAIYTHNKDDEIFKEKIVNLLDDVKNSVSD